MIIKLFGFILVLALVAKINCGDFYNVDRRNYFVSYPEKRNWYQALRYCSYFGMYLVDVHSAAENQRILTIIKRSENIYGLNRLDYWTCGTDLGSEGNFYWVSSGHQFMFRDWNSSSPNGNGGLEENCVHYWQGNLHKWNAWKCDEDMYFICRDTYDVPVCKARQCSLNSTQFY